MLDLFPDFTDSFRQFLIKNNVFVTVVGMLVGSELRTLVLSVTNNLIDPIFNIDLNNNGKDDLKCLFNSESKVLGMTFKYGKVLKDLLHFIIMIIIAFIIAYYTRQVTKTGI